MKQEDIRELALDKITPNLYCTFDEEVIEELASNIRRSGQQKPIEVWFCTECFRIVDGEKRWRACKKLRFTRIKALIVKI